MMLSNQRRTNLGFTPLEINKLNRSDGNASSKVTRKRRFLSLTGFTLVELLVVVTIIAILAAIGIVRYPNVIKKARIAEADQILATMRAAQIRYAVEHDGSYVNTANIGNLDVEVPGRGGEPVSKWFNYSSNAAGTVTATGYGIMWGITVTLTIDGDRSVTWPP